MSNTVKIIVYLVLITATVFFAAKTRSHYLAMEEPAAQVEPGSGSGLESEEGPEPEGAPGKVPELEEGPGISSMPEEGPTPEDMSEAATSENLGSKPQGKQLAPMISYGALTLLCLIGLGLMISRDVSRYMAHRAEKFFFSDDGEAMSDPEYEQAEQVWADGQFLEAVQLMREFLKKNPRELHVALRIAEIYEKDLGNYLAAALEYEEVLQHKLPAERWGWAAIHLVNLYSGKLGRSEQALELLKRIVTEYGQTAAAKKARKRLAVDDPSFLEAADEDVSDSNLPPGFSPRGR